MQCNWGTEQSYECAYPTVDSTRNNPSAVKFSNAHRFTSVVGQSGVYKHLFCIFADKGDICLKRKGAASVRTAHSGVARRDITFCPKNNANL